MFEVIFEVNPLESQFDTYLSIAASLRPELTQIPGFVNVVRYKSLRRSGWVLSLSDWESEKALIRWRTHMKHHGAQEKGRERVFNDYHLRVGEVVFDSENRDEEKGSQGTRVDRTEVGKAKFVTFVNRSAESEREVTSIADGLKLFDFDPTSEEHDGSRVEDWDIFEDLSTPGKFLLLSSFKTEDGATSQGQKLLRGGADRIRTTTIIRDYGMFDRREAPQYYPDVLVHS